MQPPPLINERYHVLEKVGSGGMALVYRAHDDILKRDVAIKFLSPERLISDEISERFLREAQAVARLSHPNIMLLFDVGREGNWHYLVLEHIPGQTLRSLMIERGGWLPLSEALRAVQGILKALSYAHQQGIIHRDIKPENVMLTPDGQIKVMDFGLALSQSELRLTQEDVILGTIFYLAPEMAMGKTADQRSDLYAIGALFYELLTGRPPFTGDNVMGIISQILHVPAALPHDIQPIPTVIEQLLLKLLAKEPANRCASADEVLTLLPDLGAAEATERRPEPSLLLYSALEEKVAAVEAERRRLAGLMQQNLAEPLNLLLGQAVIYEQTLGANPQAKMAVSVLASLARQLMQQLRDLEANLHPSMLETLGLEPALEALTSQEARISGVQVRLITARLRERLPPQVELALFRAVQEALDRAIRQVHASQITLRLEAQPQAIRLILTDNGYAELSENMLPTTRSRLEQLGGRVEIKREPKVGNEPQAELIITFPLIAPIELTTREIEVLQLLAQGMTNKEIARFLSISARTVNFHLDNIYSKLGVSTRTEAVIYALRQGWIRSNLFK